MEEVYYYIGLVIFWLSATIGTLIGVGFLLKLILDDLGNRFKMMWRVVEYFYYRVDFKEWVRDKKRHPKCEK